MQYGNAIPCHMSIVNRYCGTGLTAFPLREVDTTPSKHVYWTPIPLMPAFPRWEVERTRDQTTRDA